MISDACTPFVNAIRQARLLSDAQLAELAASRAIRYGEPRELARELVRRDWLTPFQVAKLARGRGGDLVLGKYILLERLGEGGMGQVFKARHRVMDRLVALKIIRPELLDHASAVRRFHQEIRAVAQLSHPNIVTAHDADQDGNTHFLVMEYVQGIDLKKLVQSSGRLGVRQACGYIRQAALGLQHAYERGLVHRDLKPGNLLLALPRRSPHGTFALPPDPELTPQSAVKILDLGLALLQSTDSAKNVSSTATQQGALIGTPDYMAPEQALDPRTVDIRADLYSLGCTLYFLLVGEAPFEDGSLLEKLYKHKFEPPPPLLSRRPDVPVELAAIVHKLIAKEPSDRFQTPAELVVALEPFGGAHYAIQLRPARAPFAHIDDTPSIPTQQDDEGNDRRRAASTFGSPNALPETMRVPGVSEAAAGDNPTSTAWVTLENALAALDPVAVSAAETPPMPSISSLSDFIPCNSELDRPTLPKKTGRRGRGGFVLAMLLVSIVASTLGTALAKLGARSPNQQEEEIEGTNERSETKQESQRAASDNPRDREQEEATARNGEATPPAGSREPGLAKPLRTAVPAPLAISKPERDAADPPTRGTDKPAGATEAIVCSVPIKHALDSASFAADGWRALVAGHDIVSLYDLHNFQAQHKPITTFKYPSQILLGERPPLRMAPASQDNSIMVATVDRVLVKGQVRPPSPVVGSYDPASPDPLHVIESGDTQINCVSSLPTDSRLVLTGDQQGKVCMWQLGDSLRQSHVWTNHRTVIECLAISADGSRALSGDRSGKLFVWDLLHGELVCGLSGHHEPINAVALSADGRLAVSASDDHTVRLWDVANGKEFRQLPQPLAGSIQCLAFSRDGRRLATGGRDKMVRLWDVATGSPVRSWSGHEAPVLAVTIISDGEAVYSVARDNTIRRWEPRPSAGTARP
jgi:serine/threonine protein kinase